uniref:Uncharacterized protein n=1 Tax=Gopherus evgoodei TaxID=1825980 RepID=A0A8C4VTJ2_9SAUR
SYYQQERKRTVCSGNENGPFPAYQFSVGGHLSTWPAYASGQAILQSRKPCCLPEGRRVGSGKQASLTIAKPRYLEELECYLRKELQSLDLTKENTQELKLQGRRFHK